MSKHSVIFLIVTFFGLIAYNEALAWGSAGNTYCNVVKLTDENAKAANHNDWQLNILMDHNYSCIFGYLDGLVASGARIKPSVADYTTDEIYTAVLRYCATHPNDTLQQATSHIASDLLTK